MRRHPGAMGGRSGYCDRMEATLRDWRGLFEALAAEAAGQTTGVRVRAAGCAAAFRDRREDAERMLAALRAPGGDRARGAADLERAVRELRRLVARMQRESSYGTRFT